MNEITKSTAPKLSKQLINSLPKAPESYSSYQQVVTYVGKLETARTQLNQAIDYKIGEALALAKQQLPHGEFTKACAELGYSKEEAARLRRWYEACKGAESARFDPATAEQKMSRHAREEFCRASDEVKTLVVADVSDPGIAKITAADIKRMAPVRELAQEEATHPDYNKLTELFDTISTIISNNEFTDNFSREEWYSLLGSWQSCGDGIRAKCDYIKRHESDRVSALDIDAYEAL